MSQDSSPFALAARILDVLPQTQCQRCGYADCAAYADAIASGKADINRCPPGGQTGVERLAALTGKQAGPLDPAYGAEGTRAVAWIDEAWCIGCTLCIPVCPVDAIVGGNKRLHTVIESLCTGCELCIPACPVDCIALEPVGPETGWAAWSAAAADASRHRYALHNARLRRQSQERLDHLETKAQEKLANLESHSQHTDPVILEKKRAVIEAALEKARTKRIQSKQENG